MSQHLNDLTNHRPKTLLHFPQPKHSFSPTMPALPFLPSNDTYPREKRRGCGIVQPRINPTLLLTLLKPISHKASLKNPKWVAAIKYQTWTLYALPSNLQAIGYK